MAKVLMIAWLTNYHSVIIDALTHFTDGYTIPIETY